MRPNTRPLRTWLRAFRPAALFVDLHERARVVAGAGIGILLVALVCHALFAPERAWLVAPMGASAVLVFAVSASPLAQPWAVVGGNTLSALMGVVCVRLIASPEWAAAAAVALSIAAMFAARCLHPPGGAAALLVALTGVQDPLFALFPVGVNALLLAAAGVAWNNATGRPYPHRQRSVARDEEADALDAALAQVLERHNQVLDIGLDQLKALLQDTQLAAYQRKLAATRCGDIMSRPPVSVTPGTAIAAARALSLEKGVKALPVVDAQGGIVGIVTRADFLRAAQEASGAQAMGQIMTRQVRVASERRHLSELIPLFATSGHHHIPIVGAQNRLVGVLTLSDVVAALAQAGAAA